MQSLCLPLELIKSRRSRRGEAPKRGSLEAVVTADVSRAELFLCIQQIIASLKRIKVIRATSQGVTRTGPDRVDSGCTRSQLEGRGQHGPCCRPLTTRDLVRWDLSCMALRGILPCMRVPGSTIDTPCPVRDITMYQVLPCIAMYCCVLLCITMPPPRSI